MNGKKFLWAAKGDWYNPRSNDADFIAARQGYDYTSVTTGETQIRDRYGVPARVYVFGGGDYIVMVYDKNLLTGVHGSTH